MAAIPAGSSVASCCSTNEKEAQAGSSGVKNDPKDGPAAGGGGGSSSGSVVWGHVEELANEVAELKRRLQEEEEEGRRLRNEVKHLRSSNHDLKIIPPRSPRAADPVAPALLAQSIRASFIEPAADSPCPDGGNGGGGGGGGGGANLRRSVSLGRAEGVSAYARHMAAAYVANNGEGEGTGAKASGGGNPVWVSGEQWVHTLSSPRHSINASEFGVLQLGDDEDGLRRSSGTPLSLLLSLSRPLSGPLPNHLQSGRGSLVAPRSANDGAAGNSPVGPGVSPNAKLRAGNMIVTGLTVTDANGVAKTIKMEQLVTAEPTTPSRPPVYQGRPSLDKKRPPPIKGIPLPWDSMNGEDLKSQSGLGTSGTAEGGGGAEIAGEKSVGGRSWGSGRSWGRVGSVGGREGEEVEGEEGEAEESGGESGEGSMEANASDEDEGRRDGKEEKNEKHERQAGKKGSEEGGDGEIEQLIALVEAREKRETGARRDTAASPSACAVKTAGTASGDKTKTAVAAAAAACAAGALARASSAGSGGKAAGAARGRSGSPVLRRSSSSGAGFGSSSGTNRAAASPRAASPRAASPGGNSSRGTVPRTTSFRASSPRAASPSGGNSVTRGRLSRSVSDKHRAGVGGTLDRNEPEGEAEEENEEGNLPMRRAETVETGDNIFGDDIDEEIEMEGVKGGGGGGGALRRSASFGSSCQAAAGGGSGEGGEGGEEGADVRGSRESLCRSASLGGRRNPSATPLAAAVEASRGHAAEGDGEGEGPSLQRQNVLRGKSGEVVERERRGEAEPHGLQLQQRQQQQQQQQQQEQLEWQQERQQEWHPQQQRQTEYAQEHAGMGSSRLRRSVSADVGDAMLVTLGGACDYNGGETTENDSSGHRHFYSHGEFNEGGHSHTRNKHKHEQHEQQQQHSKQSMFQRLFQRAKKSITGSSGTTRNHHHHQQQQELSLGAGAGKKGPARTMSDGAVGIDGWQKQSAEPWENLSEGVDGGGAGRGRGRGEWSHDGCGVESMQGGGHRREVSCDSSGGGGKRKEVREESEDGSGRDRGEVFAHAKIGSAASAASAAPLGQPQNRPKRLQQPSENREQRQPKHNGGSNGGNNGAPPSSSSSPSKIDPIIRALNYAAVTGRLPPGMALDAISEERSSALLSSAIPSPCASVHNSLHLLPSLPSPGAPHPSYPSHSSLHGNGNPLRRPSSPAAAAAGTLSSEAGGSGRTPLQMSGEMLPPPHVAMPGAATAGGASDSAGAAAAAGGGGAGEAAPASHSSNPTTPRLSPTRGIGSRGTPLSPLSPLSPTRPSPSSPMSPISPAATSPKPIPIRHVIQWQQQQQQLKSPRAQQQQLKSPRSQQLQQQQQHRKPGQQLQVKAGSVASRGGSAGAGGGLHGMSSSMGGGVGTVGMGMGGFSAVGNGGMQGSGVHVSQTNMNAATAAAIAAAAGSIVSGTGSSQSRSCSRTSSMRSEQDLNLSKLRNGSISSNESCLSM
ncbi:unnamed protein product [Closterium sp. Naga37s-1]|nr:unnamed protein product [Closterium sp. Naga37s-1]